ncbi:MAG: hypothetical protein KDA17_03595 [Candidatus Saccharibacteria bacterium]|jgi:hypothetical protein|nr:hypothetical protein [Candidatus Saccharibacteria bacterium]MCA9339968.1 hypothetical protein [Candidatus Saccharibacteria bacterium]
MNIIRSSSPDEAILAWLQAELASKRFQNDLQNSLDKYELSTQIITEPNLSDTSENNLRLKVLKDYRDWFEDDLYAYDWKLVELAVEDVKALRYIDYSYWNELSDNTHLVGVAAENVKRDKVVFDVSNAHFFDIAKAIETGAQFAPIVVLKREQSLEIVEGHARATGYLLADNATKPLQAIVGTL